MAAEPHPAVAGGESGWATLVRDKDLKELEKLSGVQGLARKIGTDARRGVEASAVEGLRQRFGTAFIHKGKVRPFWRILLEAAKDITLLLLTVSAVITLVFAIVITHEETDIIEGCAIVAAILVVVFVSAVQNYSQERAFDSLTRYREERRVRVVRGGRETSCSVFDLVVGDIHIVESGEVLSADGLLLRGDGVQCDESAMTGESKAITKRPALAGKRSSAMSSGDGDHAEVAADTGAGSSKAGKGSSPSSSGRTSAAPVAPASRPAPAQAVRNPTPPQQPPAGPTKSDAAPQQQQEAAKPTEGQRKLDCFMLAGTTVTSGSGQMLVLAVGLNSNYGQIIRSLEVNKPPDTPLQQQLARLGRRLGALGVSVGLLTFGVLLGAYLVAERGSGYPGITPRILNFVVVAVALVVAVVPEGLPLAVTLALAYSMRRMMKEAILVRELPACETMGSATVIATDKTGTLTENRMRTVGGWVLGTRYDTAPSATDLAAAGARQASAHGSASGPGAGGAEAARPTQPQEAGAALARLPLPAQLLCLSIVLNSSASLAAEAPPSKACASGSLRARCKRCLGRCSHLGRQHQRQSASSAGATDSDGDSATGYRAAADQAHVAITLAPRVGASGKGRGGAAVAKGRGGRAVVADAREQTPQHAAAPAAIPPGAPSHASAGGRGDGSGLHTPMLSPNSRYAAHQHDGSGDAAAASGESAPEAGGGTDEKQLDDAGDPFPQAPSRFVGNVTEGALLLWLRSHLGVDYEPLRGAAAGGDESDDEEGGGGDRAAGASPSAETTSNAAAGRPGAGSGGAMGASPATTGSSEAATPADSRSIRSGGASGAGSAVQQVHRQPFDSQRKMMATVLRVGGVAGTGTAAEGAGGAAGSAGGRRGGDGSAAAPSAAAALHAGMSAAWELLHSASDGPAAASAASATSAPHASGHSGARHLLLSKGAPEAILRTCSHVLVAAPAPASRDAADARNAVGVTDKNGSAHSPSAPARAAAAAQLASMDDTVQPETLGGSGGGSEAAPANAARAASTSISASYREHLQAVARELAASGLRVLAVSAKALGEGPGHGSGSATEAHGDGSSPRAEAFTSGGVEEGSVLLALMALQDPLRVGVQSSVQQCQDAGIRVIMVTGDALPTAVAIARGCGILTSDNGSGSGPADREEAVEVRSPPHNPSVDTAAQHKGALAPTEGAEAPEPSSRVNRLGAGATSSASSETAASSGDTRRHSPIRRGELSFAFSVNAPASDEGEGEGNGGRRESSRQHGRATSSGARVLKPSVGTSGAAEGGIGAGVRESLSSSGPLTGDSMADSNNNSSNGSGGGSSVQQVGSAVVLEGPAFRRMSDDALRQRVLPTLAVLARAVPSDKLRLVQLLQGMGETVAVTGDGTNDAPALRAAHVGVAMGIAGTEVAKEASKLIVLDDSFASVVTAVRWGRNILDVVRRFITFQLTANAVASLVTLIAAVLNRGSTARLPLTAVQLLWVNLVMDSGAALALATEPPGSEAMEYGPGAADVQAARAAAAKAAANAGAEAGAAEGAAPATEAHAGSHDADGDKDVASGASAPQTPSAGRGATDRLLPNAASEDKEAPDSAGPAATSTAPSTPAAGQHGKQQEGDAAEAARKARPPVSLITPIMRKYLAGQTLYQTGLLLLLVQMPAALRLWEVGLPSGSLVAHGEQHYTCIFNTFIFLQLANLLNARRIHDQLNLLAGLLEARVGCMIIAAVAVVQVFIVQFGGAVFETTPLTAWQWLISVALGLTSIPVGYALRLLPLGRSRMPRKAGAPASD